MCSHNTPYSQGLVTDQVIEGNKHNYHIDNLQLITNAQNANKFHNAKKAINAIREFPKSGTWMGPTPISTEPREVDFSFVTPYFDKRNGRYFVQHMIKGNKTRQAMHKTEREAKRAIFEHLIENWRE